MSGTGEVSPQTLVDYDRTKELKAFDDTKAGVKGLLDAGIQTIPKIFVRPPQELAEELNSSQTNIQVPLIDLDNIHSASRRKEIVDEVRIASEKWGFFQVINHGIPLTVLDEMIDGVRMFHEQDTEVKKKFYTRDVTKKVRFSSNYDLYQSQTANWRDTLTISRLSSDHLNPDELPAICSKSTVEYSNHVMRLGGILFELFSEALELQADHLPLMGLGKRCSLVCHYYPACPEPELTMGVTKHTDPAFLTLLLQNQLSGLQFLHEGQWIDVHPIHGGLVVNIGDLLQALSNDRFKSAEHRAIASRVGPRISVACFFTGDFTRREKPFSPIKELTSEANPPRFKEIILTEYIATFFSEPLDGKSGLDHYRL